MKNDRCFGCMEIKKNHPVCEHCGYDETQQNLPHQLPVGTVLRGQYLIGRVLGQGGFGITYLAWDLYLHAPVAIKEYYPSGFVVRDASLTSKVTCYTGAEATAYESNKERFMREGRALAKFDSLQNIVKIHSFFPENNTIYLVMEYARGRTLQQELKEKGTMPFPKIVELLEPIMKDLQKVHEEGIIHRDISPDNIMMLEGGGAKLLDFGAVRQVDNPNQDIQLSKSTEAILKQGFAPIEQYNSRGSLGPWTDVYALCSTICYCLNGKLPLAAPDRTYDEDPDHFIDILPITEAQKDVLRKGMAVKPRNRTASVPELLEGLKESLKDKPKETPGKKADGQGSSSRKKSAAEADAGKPAKRLPGWLIPVGIAGAAAVLGLVLLLPRIGQKPDAQQAAAATETAQTTEASAPMEMAVTETAETAAAAVPTETAAETAPSEETGEKVSQKANAEHTQADLVLKNFDPSGESDYAFGTDVRKQEIGSVEFLDSLAGAPADAIDVSETGNGGVLLWMKPGNNGFKNMFIAGDGKVIFPRDSGYLFGGANEPQNYGNAERIEFHHAVDTGNVTRMEQMFGRCVGLRSLDVSSFDTSNVTNMNGMFWNCLWVPELDLSNFDTSNVTDMGTMFSVCEGLTSLNVSSFDTSRVTDMHEMFNSCGGLTTLDVSNFDTSNVTEMEWMFAHCSKLETLDLSSFDTSRARSFYWMFRMCCSLKTLDLSGFKVSGGAYTNEMFELCTSLTETGLITENAAIRAEFARK